jgi:hypothetical protein
MIRLRPSYILASFFRRRDSSHDLQAQVLDHIPQQMQVQSTYLCIQLSVKLFTPGRHTLSRTFALYQAT